jgi:hypothetical protein
MIFMPLDFLLRWLTGLLTSALLGGGIYVLHEWYTGELIDRAWLILGWGLVGWSILGFLPLSLLRRWGKNEPKMRRSQEVQRLTRPDGSEIQVEFYGSPDAPPLILTHGWGPQQHRLVLRQAATSSTLSRYCLGLARVRKIQQAEEPGLFDRKICP